MIDIDTHRVIDLIPSRDCEDVVKWLQSYPNLQVVSRDGSITYKNAITLAHPHAIQVSDRFHILKNLTSYCKDYLINYFKPKVIIDAVPRVETSDAAVKSSIENKKLTLEEKITKGVQLLQDGSVKSQICKQLNMDIRVLNKLLAMNDDERSLYVKNSFQILHDEKVANKLESIAIVRDMYKKKYSIRKIAEELGMARQTIRKYLNANVSAINGNYNVKRKSIVDPFLDEVNQLRDKGYTFAEIENVIRKNGYSGSGSTLRNYIARLKRNTGDIYINKKKSPITTELVERKQLLKLLYKPIIEVKGLSVENINKVNDKYPAYKEIIDLVYEFRSILKSKTITAFDKWID